MGWGRSVDLLDVNLLLSFRIDVSVDGSQVWEQVRGKNMIVGYSLDVILNHILIILIPLEEAI